METYNTLKNFIENDNVLKEPSKKTAIGNLSRLKNYPGDLSGINDLVSFIHQNMTDSIKYNLYGILVKYYRSIDEPDNSQVFYKLRDEHIKAVKDKPIPENVFNGLTSDDFLKKLDEVPNNPYKLIMWLGVKYPANRISDYTILQYALPANNKTHNFIDEKMTMIVFNKFVKTPTTDRIVHRFDKQDKILVKKCLTGIKPGSIFPIGLSQQLIQRDINKVAKFIGLKTFHDARKLKYSDAKVRDCIDTINNIARVQGHNISTVISHYA
jgi:hypothetical protein